MIRGRSFRFRQALTALAVVLGLLHPLRAGTEEALPDPFEDAQFLPASITQFYCFVDAGEELREVLDSSLAPGLQTFYEKCRSGRSWRELAQSTGIEPNVLFDMLVSRRVTLVTDQEDENRIGPGPVDYSRWVMMARVEEPFALDLLRMLGGRVREFVEETPVYAAEGGSLRFAYRDGRFYVAASNAHALFRSMLATTINPALCDDEEFREARRVGPGDFGMFKRGRGDVHWEAGAAKMRRDYMQINLVKRHEPKPVNRDQTDAINLGLLETLGEEAVYVGIERTPDSSSLPCERTASTGILPIVPLVRAKPGMLEHLGPTMITVIGPPATAGSGLPAMTVAIEMRSPQAAVGELDEFMAQATARLSGRRRRSDDATPPVEVINAGAAPETLRVAACGGSGMPARLLGLEGTWPAEVVWSSAITDDRAWWVASTDRESQSRILGKVQSFTETCRKPSRTEARGVVFGSRLASLMQPWPAVNSESKHPFLAELFAWRELLTCVRDIKWRVSRPSDERTETYVSVSWR